MSDTNYGHPGNEGRDRPSGSHDRAPYWKRAHHDWRFWVGLVVTLVAISMYVMSDDLALVPRRQPPQPPPAAVGR